MVNELVIQDDFSKQVSVKKDINQEHDLSVIERVVMQGDLSKLDPTQRVTYYHKVCESIGLNPYTRPFDYISLNGKLTLYAKKDATEQLRQVKKISIIELEGKLVDDLYIVVAKAATPDGRTDQATGAVSIANLKGEQKANAIMKAETKAKRRVTLSISGMGWTDESEVESIPNAKYVDVNIETGEINERSNNAISYVPQKLENREELIINLGDILEECGVDYENKILAHYKIKNINFIPDEDLKKVIQKALAFREIRLKQNDSIPG